MIDYSLIAKSISFYESAGFARIESPWTVTRAVSDITRPPDAKDFELKHDNNKVLVASAEQSFLYLYLKGFLPRGQFQSVTPCYRNENFDNWHTKYFIKNELIKTDDVSESALTWVIYTALGFFVEIFGPDKLQVTKTYDAKFLCDSWDITLTSKFGSIELGSYGIRECPFLRWIYGTGCASPRTNMALDLIK